MSHSKISSKAFSLSRRIKQSTMCNNIRIQKNVLAIQENCKIHFVRIIYNFTILGAKICKTILYMKILLTEYIHSGYDLVSSHLLYFFKLPIFSDFSVACSLKNT